MHFERMAAEYAEARPTYPHVIFDTLERAGVIGPGRRVLEIGAGAGLATKDLTRVGSKVTALEPGAQLRVLLREAVPGVEMIAARLEDAQLPEQGFDSVVAATSMHWVDLAVGLPKLHAAVRPGGWLAVWRTIFGDDGHETEFRNRVSRIVSERTQPDDAVSREQRPTMQELAAGGWFEPVGTERWRWAVDLDTDQVLRLFRTFSDWSPAEAEKAARAAHELGGVVTEHYQSVLHLLHRSSLEPA